MEKNNIIIIVLILLLLPYAFGTFEHFYKSYQYPFQLDETEGYILDQALIFHNGGNIYKPLDDFPFIVSTYGPVFPYINSFLVDPEFPKFDSGRLLSFLSLCGILILAILFIKKFTDSIIGGFLFAALYLNSYEVLNWCVYYRVDFLGIFFSFCGLLIFSYYNDVKRPRLILFLSALFFALGFFTKQTQLAAPISAVLYLFLNDKKSAIKNSIIIISPLIIIFILLTIITKGQYYLHNVVYNANKFDFWQVKQMTKNLLWVFNKYTLILMILLMIFNPQKKNLISIYLYLCLLLIPTIGKVGSAENYFLEPLLGIYLFICINFYNIMRFNTVETPYTGVSKISTISTMPDIQKGDAHIGRLYKYIETLKTKLPIILTTIAIILFTTHAYNIASLHKKFVWVKEPTTADMMNGDRVLSIIKKHSGDIISEDAAFLILSSREVLYEPFIMSTLAKEGKWNDKPIIDAIENKRFSLIITTVDLFNKEQFFFNYNTNFIDAVKKNYHLLEVVGKYYIYCRGE